MSTHITGRVWAVALVPLAVAVGMVRAHEPSSGLAWPMLSASVPAIVVEGEALVASAQATAGPVSAQEMAGFGAAWTGGSQLFWRAAQVGDRLSVTVTVPVAGRYSIAGAFTKAPDYGNFQVLANDVKLETFFGYETRVVHSGRVVLGRADLKAGANRLNFEIVGKDRQSTGLLVGIDRIELTRLGEVVVGPGRVIPPVVADPGPIPDPSAAVVARLPAVQMPARAVVAQPFTWVKVEPVEFKKASFDPNELPNADLRPIILAKGMKLRDQGNRGTCSVHAMTFLLEYMYATQKNLNFQDLSEEYLNYVTNLVSGKNADGDFFSNLDLGYQKWGTYPEALVPYKATFDPKYKVPQPYMDVGKKWARFEADFIKPWNANAGATMGDLYRVMIYLEKNTPVAVGMWWPTPGNFKTVQIKGIDVMVTPKQRKVDCADGHSVAIVGYRKDPAFAGGGYFIFRNSYGPTWGDSGYGYLPFEYLLKYANDLVAYRE